MLEYPKTIAEDHIDGVQGIADFLGITKRRAQHLIDAGLLPVGRIGRRICGSKRVLTAYWQKITGGEVA